MKKSAGRLKWEKLKFNLKEFDLLLLFYNKRPGLFRATNDWVHLGKAILENRVVDDLSSGVCGKKMPDLKIEASFYGYGYRMLTRRNKSFNAFQI